ncbi:hypothetical protein L204_100428 [Cryptococcus depauperatus]
MTAQIFVSKPGAVHTPTLPISERLFSRWDHLSVVWDRQRCICDKPQAALTQTDHHSISVEACGASGADFSYVYKTTKRSQGKLVMGTGPNRIKKLGKRPKNEEPKKYDNPCDDPNSVLGCCRFSEQDLLVFHDRTQL